MKLSIYLIALAILFSSCNQEKVDPQPSNITLTEKSAKIVAADNEFGLELFQKVNASQTEKKNTMISPLSVSLALAMIYNGTKGDTKTQMETMLHKSGLTAEEINQSYKDLVSSLASHDSKVELGISNAIFYRNTFPVKTDFISTNQNYYQAEVSGLDFNKTAEALSKVNGWVNTKTKEKIDKIIDEVKPEDIMYLLNAIYFNGEWQYRFDQTKTTPMDFTREDNSVVRTPMMTDRKSTRLNSSHSRASRMPSSA